MKGWGEGGRETEGGRDRDRERRKGGEGERGDGEAKIKRWVWEELGEEGIERGDAQR